MAKKRVFSHEKKRLKNEKHFSFFFYLFAPSSLMTVYILLKNFKVCCETPPIEKSAPHETYRLALQVS